MILALVTAVAGATQAGATTVTGTLDGIVVEEVRADADWIVSAQLPDGAIAHHVDRVAVWPYLSNFAAAGLARASASTGDPAYVEAAWDWLDWYRAHQDASGFVTDYDIVDGVPVSTGDMDSTDAYAGTYLLAVREAWRVSGDRPRLGDAHPGIVAAVDAIEATQDADGLTWAKPSWRVKYLMDQAETFAGLVAAEELASDLGDRDLARRARRDAQQMKKGVEALWNAGTEAFDWAVHDDGSRTATDWDVLYPDALQQAWAVAFGLVEGDRAAAIMQRFATEHPDWALPTATALSAGGSGPVGYWAPVGWAFDAVGRHDVADAAGESIRAAAVAAERAWPFTPSDAGQLIVLRDPSGSFLEPAPAPTRGGGPKKR